MRTNRLLLTAGGLVALIVDAGPVRRIWVDNSTDPVTFWVGSNHGASIIKLEPLD